MINSYEAFDRECEICVHFSLEIVLFCSSKKEEEKHKVACAANVQGRHHYFGKFCIPYISATEFRQLDIPGSKDVSPRGGG